MTTRPWRIRDFRDWPPYTHTYGSIDTALASAIVRCIHDPNDIGILIENRDTKEVFQVYHLGKKHVIVTHMTFGPDNKWMKW